MTNKQQQKQNNNIMSTATISSNFPRTFNKLSNGWSKKTGTRIYKDPIFTKCPQSEPISHVPFVFGEALNQVENLVAVLQTLVPETNTTERALWVYDMRASDALPRTTADTERLYSFVRKIIQSDWFDTSTGMYLEKHIHITVAFFVWWFTTENFYFATNEIRQTTYHGIRRVWTPVLLSKRPLANTVAPKIVQRSVVAKQPTVSLVKEVAKCQELQEKILALVREEHSGFTVQWEDDLQVHLKISLCFDRDSEYYMTGKKSKKLQKMYQDYSKMKKKKEVSNALTEETKMPAAPVAAEAEAAPICQGCLTSQPNQLAHMGPGGCLGDEDDEEEVPESWEDL